MPGDRRSQRIDSYTTPRPDVAALVPDTARSLLDLGCSTGAFAAAFRDRGLRVVGLEADPDMAAEAATRLDAVHRVDLTDPDWHQVLAGERFDVVVAADVLEHLPDPDAVLAAAVGHLAEHGSVIVSIPNIRHVSALIDIAVHGTFPRRSRGIFDETHLRWFTWRDVLALHERAGLRIDDWSTNLRLVDRPGAPSSERIERLLGRWRRRRPIREFLSYQFVVRSSPTP